MQDHATRRQAIAGVLAPRGVRAGTDAGRTWAAESHGRRLIFCETRNRTAPISGFAKNGNAPARRLCLNRFAFISVYLRLNFLALLRLVWVEKETTA